VIVARGADDVGCVAPGGRAAGCGDAGTTGATGPAELAGAIGAPICEGAARNGPTVACAFGGASTLRASGATSTLKTRTTLSAAASVTSTRPMSDEYAGASRGTGWSANHCIGKVKPKRIAPAAMAMATARRTSLVPSTTLPQIAPIVAPTMISRSCCSALNSAGSKDAPSRLPTQPGMTLPADDDARSGPLRRR